MKKTKSLIPVIIVALSLSALSARAAIIPNNSFESPDVSGDTDGYVNTISDFDETGIGDGTQYNDSTLFASVPDGHQFAFLQASSLGTSTTIVTSSSVGTTDASQTYTLSLYVGNRLDGDYADDGTYTLDFYAGGTLLTATTGGTLAGSSITPGTFDELTATYNPLVSGQDITVGVTFISGATGFHQGDVDDFVLTSAATLPTTPEPATFALLGAGMLVLMVSTRRKSKA